MNNRGARMTRRTVLGGALACATLGGFSAWGAADTKSKMKIGCGTVCFRKLPLKEALERIRRAGYEYIETQATGPWCPHVDTEKDDPQKFRELVNSFGFKGVTGLWTSHGAIIPDAKSVEGITRTIRWAKEAGIPIVHAGDGRKPDAMSEADALKVLGERLAAILEVAEKCQVYLAIEPHGTFSLTADGLKKILALSPSKWLGINYDTANVHRATYAETASGAYKWPLFGKRQDEVTTLKEVIDRVVHVHVKDVKGATCVALGEGSVNVRGCVEYLKSRGYAGALSLETEGDNEAEDMQRLIEASYRYLMREV